MDEFLDYLKEEVLPGVWSKGIALSRNSKSVERVSPASEKNELKFKIQTTERMLAFQVTLWPKEHDAHCNCGSKIEPCHHVVAVALAVQNGLVSLDDDASQNEGARLEYQWIYEEGVAGKKPKISLKRSLLVKGEPVELPSSLTSYLGGIQSGRISSPLPSVTPIDLKIDELFSKPNPQWGEVFKTLRDLPELKVLGHPTLQSLKIDANPKNPSLTFTDHGSHSILVTADRPEPGLELESGLQLKGNTLSVRGPHLHFQTQVLHPNQFEAFITHELPKLKESFELIFQTTRLPILVEADPELKLNLHPLNQESISVTATIEYPKLKRGELAARNLKREGELIKDARSQWNLNVDQPVTLLIKDALLLKEKKLDSPSEVILDTFLGNYFQSQGGISLETALKEKETLLKLLTLKEKKQTQDPRFQAFLQNFSKGSRNEIQVSTPVHPELWKKLRDYQKTGVQWLHQQEQSLQGAILADDMGLGKTLQTLCVLGKKSLVVMPTSLLQNWKNEATRFRPDLRVQIYHGPNRQWDESADLTLTTYSLLRIEPARFLSQSWNTVVLDEAHLIRNPETQAAIATSKLNASFRIALTGTPIQNRKRDLFSLFQFVAPDFFETENQLDPKLTAPFFLRRTKEEVLKELPPKTYLEHWIELNSDERSLYQSLFLAAKKEILEKLDQDGNLSPFTLFEVLLRTRQVCNHPGLVDPAKLSISSSKLQELMALTEELLEAGHSVLIYSQWTQFLNRLEQELKGKAPYFRLDGSTQNRGQVVEQFQNSTHPTVFLLSLHAGGIGLNLMKASHVIFCDPWWNPFVELQAEDRAYRMGQEKPVTIHRLLTLDSIEIQIRELQNQKRTLGEEVFQKQDLSSFLETK